MNDEEKRKFIKQMGYGGAPVRSALGLKNDFPKRAKRYDNEVSVEDLRFADKLMNPQEPPPKEDDSLV